MEQNKDVIQNNSRGAKIKIPNFKDISESQRIIKPSKFSSFQQEQASPEIPQDEQNNYDGENIKQGSLDIDDYQSRNYSLEDVREYSDLKNPKLKQTPYFSQQVISNTMGLKKEIQNSSLSIEDDENVLVDSSFQNEKLFNSFILDKNNHNMLGQSPPSFKRLKTEQKTHFEYKEYYMEQLKNEKQQNPSFSNEKESKSGGGSSLIDKVQARRMSGFSYSNMGQLQNIFRQRTGKNLMNIDTTDFFQTSGNAAGTPQPLHSNKSLGRSFESRKHSLIAPHENKEPPHFGNSISSKKSSKTSLNSMQKQENMLEMIKRIEEKNGSSLKIKIEESKNQYKIIRDASGNIDLSGIKFDQHAALNFRSLIDHIKMNAKIQNQDLEKIDGLKDYLKGSSVKESINLSAISDVINNIENPKIESSIFGSDRITIERNKIQVNHEEIKDNQNFNQHKDELSENTSIADDDMNERQESSESSIVQRNNGQIIISVSNLQKVNNKFQIDGQISQQSSINTSSNIGSKSKTSHDLAAERNLMNRRSTGFFNGGDEFLNKLSLQQQKEQKEEDKECVQEKQQFTEQQKQGSSPISNQTQKYVTSFQNVNLGIQKSGDIFQKASKPSQFHHGRKKKSKHDVNIININKEQLEQDFKTGVKDIQSLIDHMNYPVREKKIKSKMCYYNESSKNDQEKYKGSKVIQINDKQIDLGIYNKQIQNGEGMCINTIQEDNREYDQSSQSVCNQFKSSNCATSLAFINNKIAQAAAKSSELNLNQLFQDNLKKQYFRMKTTSYVSPQIDGQNVIMEGQKEEQYAIQKQKTLGKRDNNTNIKNSNVLNLDNADSNKIGQKNKMSPGLISDFSLSIIESDQFSESNVSSEKIGTNTPQDKTSSINKEKQKVEESKEKNKIKVKSIQLQKDSVKQRYIFSHDYNHDKRSSKPCQAKSLIMMVKKMNRQLRLEDKSLMPTIIQEIKDNQTKSIISSYTLHKYQQKKQSTTNISSKLMSSCYEDNQELFADQLHKKYQIIQKNKHTKRKRQQSGEFGFLDSRTIADSTIQSQYQRKGSIQKVNDSKETDIICTPIVVLSSDQSNDNSISESFAYVSHNNSDYSPDGQYDEEEDGSSFVRILDENISKYTIRDFRQSRQDSFLTDNHNCDNCNSNRNVLPFSDKSDNINQSIDDQTPKQSSMTSIMRQFKIDAKSRSDRRSKKKSDIIKSSQDNNSKKNDIKYLSGNISSDIDHVDLSNYSQNVISNSLQNNNSFNAQILAIDKNNKSQTTPAQNNRLREYKFQISQKQDKQRRNTQQQSRPDYLIGQSSPVRNVSILNSEEKKKKNPISDIISFTPKSQQLLTHKNINQNTLGPYVFTYDAKKFHSSPTNHYDYQETPVGSIKNENSNASDDFSKVMRKISLVNIPRNSNETNQDFSRYSSSNTAKSPVTATNFLNKDQSKQKTELEEIAHNAQKIFTQTPNNKNVLKKTKSKIVNFEIQNKLQQAGQKINIKSEEYQGVTINEEKTTINLSNKKLQRMQTESEQNISQDLLATPLSANQSRRQKKQYFRNKTVINDAKNDEQPYMSSLSPNSSRQASQFRENYTISTNSCVSQKRNGKKQINQYVVMNLIGKGMFSKVKKILDSNTKKYYAMKIIDKQRLRRRSISPVKTQWTLVEKEVAIMKNMEHPNVMKLIEVIDDPNHHKQYLIQEFIPNGDLLKKIRKSNQNPLIESQIRKYFRQLISAVWYCHEIVHIAHRDIKPDNILLDKDDNIKLTDFGVSDILNQKTNNSDGGLMSGNAGSDCYFSPEACTGQQYSGKMADLWACAVTLYQMTYQNLPFVAKGRIELYKKIQNEEPLYLQKDLTMKECIGYENLKDLLIKMLNKEPSSRISIKDIQTHPWITNNGIELLDLETDNDYNKFQDVTQDDIQQAIGKVEKIKNVYFKKKL